MMGPEVRLHEQDVDRLWAELRASGERRLGELKQTPSAQRAHAQHQLLLALELRWKLEEQVLLPVLQDFDLDGSEIEQEIGLLRDLAELVRRGMLDALAANVVLAALAGIAMLCSQRIGRALSAATSSKRIDSSALAAEMEDFLARCAPRRRDP